jgi:hypothetical protein
MRRLISTAMLRLRRALREKTPQTCSIKSACAWRRDAAWAH